MTFRTPARFRRLAPLAAAGMAFAVVLGACGSSATPTPTPPPDPKAMLANSAASLTALKSFHIDIELSGTLTNPTPSAGSPASVTLDGTKLSADVDIAGQKGSASLTTPAGLGGLSASAVVSGDIYIKAPTILGTDKWEKIPSTMLSALSAGALPGLASAMPSASAGPLGGLSALTNFFSTSGVTVTSGGTDSCADGTCNKTVITIPAAVIQQALTAAAAESSTLGSSVPNLNSLGTIGDATLTIWTGASNSRFNKLTFSVSAGSSGNLTLAVALSNFDQPVTVTVPPADQTQDFSLGG